MDKLTQYWEGDKVCSYLEPEDYYQELDNEWTQIHSWDYDGEEYWVYWHSEYCRRFIYDHPDETESPTCPIHGDLGGENYCPRC